MLSLTCLIKKKATLFFLVCYFPVHVLPSAELAAGAAFLSEKISDHPHEDAEKEQQDSFKKYVCILGAATGGCVGSFIGGLLLNKNKNDLVNDGIFKNKEFEIKSLGGKHKASAVALTEQDTTVFKALEQKASLLEYDVATLLAELDIIYAQLADLGQSQQPLEKTLPSGSFSLSDYTADDNSV